MKIYKKVQKSLPKPKLHKDGVNGVHGGYTNAELSQDTVLPILISHKERLTKLLIIDGQHQAHYAKTSHTMAKLRWIYWTSLGCAEVKEALKYCLVCVRYQRGHAE